MTLWDAAALETARGWERTTQRFPGFQCAVASQRFACDFVIDVTLLLIAIIYAVWYFGAALRPITTTPILLRQQKRSRTALAPSCNVGKTKQAEQFPHYGK